MPKPESFPIDKIYVPVKRKKALKPELVQEIAESILEIGQQAPILVRCRNGSRNKSAMAVVIDCPLGRDHGLERA